MNFADLHTRLVDMLLAAYYREITQDALITGMLQVVEVLSTTHRMTREECIAFYGNAEEEAYFLLSFDGIDKPTRTRVCDDNTNKDSVELCLTQNLTPSARLKSATPLKSPVLTPEREFLRTVRPSAQESVH